MTSGSSCAFSNFILSVSSPQTSCTSARSLKRDMAVSKGPVRTSTFCSNMGSDGGGASTPAARATVAAAAATAAASSAASAAAGLKALGLKLSSTSASSGFTTVKTSSATSPGLKPFATGAASAGAALVAPDPATAGAATAATVDPSPPALRRHVQGIQRGMKATATLFFWNGGLEHGLICGLTTMVLQGCRTTDGSTSARYR
mmetsp:Transcript_63844/g.177108  ORF Transcript_63844/g.177108 Transcript_63844/m.177108 type:complete len:203 (-) Transcript_63844:1611-2219(-)